MLEVARDWAQLDKHGGDEPEDTEEEEMPFIDDEQDLPYVYTHPSHLPLTLFLFLVVIRLSLSWKPFQMTLLTIASRPRQIVQGKQ